MKRKITISIALVLSFVLVSLTSSDSTVNAQNQIKIIGDTGVNTLGPNQILRISGDGVDQDDAVTLRFRQINYAQPTSCTGGICKQTVISQNLSEPITLAPGEAATFTCLPAALPVRVVVSSNNRNVRVNVMIIDGATGEVVTSYVLKDVLISS